jgi:uncharacterized protein (DUF2062 family)
MIVEPKLSWLWVLAIPLVIAGTIWWYMSTNAVRRYKDQTEQMRMIWERQDLDMKLHYQRQELIEINAQIQAEQKVAVPVGPASSMMPFMPPAAAEPTE